MQPLLKKKQNKWSIELQWANSVPCQAQNGLRHPFLRCKKAKLTTANLAWFIKILSSHSFCVWKGNSYKVICDVVSQKNNCVHAFKQTTPGSSLVHHVSKVLTGYPSPFYLWDWKQP